jgi:hypothetical protein
MLPTGIGLAVGNQNGTHSFTPPIVVVTNDGGERWSDVSDAVAAVALRGQPSMSEQAIDCSPAGVLRILGASLVSSFDGGQTWRDDTDASRSPNDLRFELRFADALNGWILGANGTSSFTRRTVDGGATWTAHPGPGGFGVDFLDPQRGVLVSTEFPPPSSNAPTVGKAFRTEDGGVSWIPVSLPPGIGGLSDVEFAR